MTPAGRQVPIEDFVAGRLTLQALRNGLDLQVATLRSELTIAESQLRQTDDLLRRADEKMAAQHPEAFARLVGGEHEVATRKPARRRTS